MPKALELAGQRFGKLVAIERSSRANDGAYTWLCQCDCGQTKVVIGRNLKRGNSTSCGCTHRAMVSAMFTKHGNRSHPLWQVWHDMINRCTNPLLKNFHRYGGRGIKVCEEWLVFENFVRDMMPTFQEGLTLDRADNDGNYGPSNCRWITHSEQASNTSRNVYVEHDGVSMTLTQVARATGINPVTMHNRYRRGLRGEALIAPVSQARGC